MTLSVKAFDKDENYFSDLVFTGETEPHSCDQRFDNTFEDDGESHDGLNAELLAKKAKDGDSLSFALLADKYHRFLLKYVSSFDVPYIEREDLMQEGLVGLLKAVRSYDGSSASFTTYAFHCMKSNIISALRRYSRQTKASIAEQNIDRSTFDLSASPESAFIDKESTRQLHDKFFSVLSVYESKVFEMYLAEMPCSEIAKTLNKESKSIDNALQRIKTKLKKLV